MEVFLYLQEIIISYCRKLMTKKLVIVKKLMIGA